MPACLEYIKVVSNIAFFLTISVVTILSFLQARKTLFQPIKTEVFKLQLKELSEIREFFGNKEDGNFIEELDLPRIVYLNSLRTVSEYIATFFPKELSVPEESFEDLTHLIIRGSDLHRGDPYRRSEPEKANNDVPETQPPWSEYRAITVGYTGVFDEKMRLLTKFMTSPILPKPLQKEIGAFKSIAEGYLDTIWSTIQDSSTRMPELYPTSEQIEKFSSEWIYDEFMRRRVELDTPIQAVMAALSKYLKRVSNLAEL